MSFKVKEREIALYLILKWSKVEIIEKDKKLETIHSCLVLLNNPFDQ